MRERERLGWPKIIRITNYSLKQIAPPATCPPTYLTLSIFRTDYLASFRVRFAWKNAEMNEKKLTYQRPRKKVSSVRTLGGCGHQRGRWRLCCGTSEYRTSVPSTGCRSCSGPENMTHMIRTTKFVQVGTNVSGRESLTKRSWTQSISESQSRQ